MRVYQRGEVIPMDQVTWATLCHPATVVTSDDPEQVWPEHIYDASAKALTRAAKYLGVIDRFKQRVQHNG